MGDHQFTEAGSDRGTKFCCAVMVVFVTVAGSAQSWRQRIQGYQNRAGVRA